jgi:hypothetical protein
MNTAINQGFTAKLAEMYPFKRTQGLEALNQAGPSKEARRDLQPYTNHSSWQWYTLKVCFRRRGL